MIKTCITCQKEFESAPLPGVGWTPSNCPTCSAAAIVKQEQEWAAAKTSAKSRRWESICPPIFRDTDPERLPKKEKLEEVLAWIYGPTGLILHGPTRTGKSRCAWLLVKKILDAGLTIRVMNSMSGFKYGSQFAIGANAPEEWVLKHCRVDVLFMDDVFKVKLTDSFEAAMFAIIEHRMGNLLPIIATLNDTGKSLAGRMSVDRGAALVARIKETCKTIKF